MNRYIPTLLLVIFIFSGCGIFSDRPPRIPTEDFFRSAEKRNLQLSPDGTRLSYLKSWKKRLNLEVMDIHTFEKNQITHSRNDDIYVYFWKTNSEIIYLKDTNGDEKYRIYCRHVPNGKSVDLTPFDSVNIIILDRMESDPEHILIGMNHNDPRLFDVYKLNIHTKKLEMVFRNTGAYAAWWPDKSGTVRVVYRIEGDKGIVFYRQQDSQSFKQVLVIDAMDEFRPVLFRDDSPVFLVLTNVNHDKISLVEFNAYTGRFGKVIYEHPQVDIEKVMISNKLNHPLAVRFTTEKTRYVALHSDFEPILQDIQQRLGNRQFTIENHSQDENRFLIKVFDPHQPGIYYYYDSRTREFVKLVDMAPWLKEGQLALARPIRFKSADGLEINGYLTLPKGVDSTHLPLVINPHGGPWLRNKWDFSGLNQMLANRGIAVLEINYRGSTGYGKAFFKKGFRQVGTGMQQDILAGLQWAIDKGYADPEHVGIFGYSFGGFFALSGAAFQPDKFKCVVSYCGLSNMINWLNNIPPYWEPFRGYFDVTLGNVKRDSAHLAAISPAFHVENVQAPVLIAQGKNDPRVPVSEAEFLVARLKKANKDVHFILKEDEGHGFRKEENRLEFYKAVDTFFQRHLLNTPQ